jgi:hypothetical protein
MSDSSDSAAVPTGDENVPSTPQGLGPRRHFSGALLQVEQQMWPDHPKNQKYLGSENSAANNSNVNVPAP